MVLEYRNYKDADASHGAASSSYRRERKQREAEAKANTRNWTEGRQTFTPRNLTPESHYELLPMAVDWKDKAQRLVLAIKARA